MVILRKQRNKPKASQPKGVLSRIKPISFDADAGIKVNVYGRSGSGKTTFWATFPKPALAIICSGGKQTGELRSIATPTQGKGIKTVTLEEPDELRELVEMQQKTGTFQTVVLDHITDFQNMILKEVLGIDRLPEQKAWGTASQQQYGTTALKMKEYLRSLLDLPCNIVLIGQERVFDLPSDEDSGNELIQPYIASAVTKSVVGWLNPAVDYVVQTFIRPETINKPFKVGKRVKHRIVETGKFEYCLRTNLDAIHQIKFRVPKGHVLPDCIVDPDYDKLMAVIKGK